MENFIVTNLSFMKLFLLFVIYSFFGWIFEVAYAYTHRGYFVNRGFLFGPFCPIYGSGVILILWSVDSFKDNIILLFIASTVLTSVIEYVTSYVLEKLFNSKWWDYTEDPFNINGRICLPFSLMWGAACVLIIKIVQPIFEFLIEFIPNSVLFYSLSILIVYFICDFVLTIISLIQLNKILSQMLTSYDELMGKSKQVFSNTKSKAKDTFGTMRVKYENQFEKLNFNHIRLIKAFPTVKSNKFDVIFKEIQNKFKLLTEFNIKDKNKDNGKHSDKEKQ